MPHCRVQEARDRCRIDGSTGCVFLARGNEGLHSIRVRVIVMMRCAALRCAALRCPAVGAARRMAVVSPVVGRATVGGGGMLNPSRALFDVVRRRRLIFLMKEGRREKTFGWLTSDKPIPKLVKLVVIGGLACLA